MKFLLTIATTSLALITGLAPRSDACLVNTPRCMCTTGNAPFASFVRAVASGSVADSSNLNGMFLDVTVRSAGYTDSVTVGGRPRPDYARAKLVREFVVTRSWTRPSTSPPPATVRFYDPLSNVCPNPAWRVGERYLVFAVSVRDTLRALAPCGRVHPIDSADTRAAIATLDSLLRRW